jgi:hypothetical protein
MDQETITFMVGGVVVKRPVVTRFGNVYLTHLQNGTLGLMFPKYLNDGIEYLLPRKSHSISRKDLSAFKTIDSYKADNGGEFVLAEYEGDIFYLCFSNKNKLVLGGWIGPAVSDLLEGIKIALLSNFRGILMSAEIINLKFEGGKIQVQK